MYVAIAGLQVTFRLWFFLYLCSRSNSVGQPGAVSASHLDRPPGSCSLLADQEAWGGDQSETRVPIRSIRNPEPSVIEHQGQSISKQSAYFWQCPSYKTVLSRQAVTYLILSDHWIEHLEYKNPFQLLLQFYSFFFMGLALLG